MKQDLCLMSHCSRLSQVLLMPMPTSPHPFPTPHRHTCVLQPDSVMRCSPPFTLQTVFLNVLPVALTWRYLVSSGWSNTLWGHWLS